MATMPTDPNAPDYWCLMAAYLSEIYYSAVAGGQETLIRSRGADSEEEVRYNKMDLATLRDEMNRAQDKCNEANGVVTTPRRFAITAGARRRFPPTREI
jgi:hypothetical protein